MQKNKYISLTLLAASFIAGCSSIPRNTTLDEARQSYANARNNPEVTSHAAIELKEAGDSLTKADNALSKGESVATVEQLAYVAKQKVAIAEETAKSKAAELEVTKSSAKRDQIRLESRTAEADAAKEKAALAQQANEQQAAALTTAQAKAQSDQARLQERELRLQERTAEAENAKQKALEAQQMADKKAAELAAANAKTEVDQARLQERELRLAERTAEAEAAKQAAINAQKMADQKAAELATASANAERDRALIAKQESELNALNAKKTERGMVITLSDVLFGSNKTKLQSGGMRSLHKLADFLKQYPQRKVLVEGYTDSTGSDDHNQELSERRADAVKTALEDMGISSERISTRGYGKSFPVASNSTAASRQLNRRVEIIFSDEHGKNASERSR